MQSGQTNQSDLPENARHRLPLHVEISEMLAREIQSGLLESGARLSPERTMSAQLGVSVGTLRKALDDLANKGLIERVHGSGNYVRKDVGKSSVENPTIYSFFRLELIKGGGLPTAEVISVDRLQKPASLPLNDDYPEGFRIRRLRRLNGIDAALEDIWIDAPPGQTLEKEHLSDSLYLFYKQQLGFWIARAEDSVSVAVLPDWKPDDFGSSNGDQQTVWGYVERSSYDQNNQCVEFSHTWFDPKTTRFRARWK